MTELPLPWLELSVLIPLLGAVWVSRMTDADRARERSLQFSGVVLLTTVAAWYCCGAAKIHEVHDPYDPVKWLLGRNLFVLDELSAPLLPMVALLFLLVKIATLRTKIRRYSFSWALLSEAILLATLSCKEPWAVIAFLSLGTLPPLFELEARDKPSRVYVLHMGLYIALLWLGWLFVLPHRGPNEQSLWAVVPILLAVCIRSGSAPFHCWMTDLFEHASFGTALLFIAPLTGAYAAVRLLLPIAPDWILRTMGHVALFTAFYAAGMALVQREARRFFCYLFISHSALVFMGLDAVTPHALTGALCVWLSVTLGLTGFGLTLRAIEARHGRISLSGLHGYYGHTPLLATCFLITGLASVGFPGTFGFLGAELLLDGIVQAYPYDGMVVVLVTALNGIAVMQTYFTIFAGSHRTTTVSLRSRIRERIAVATLAALIFGGAIFPQASVSSRHRAALELLTERGTKLDNTAGQHAWWDDKPAETEVAPHDEQTTDAAPMPEAVHTLDQSS
jgi:NADH-quinone oxidoreductase subunit M